jgi:hypothetical protein
MFSSFSSTIPIDGHKETFIMMIIHSIGDGALQQNNMNSNSVLWHPKGTSL